MPHVASFAAALYAPVMLLVTRFLDSPENRRDCALQEELARLRDELWESSPATTRSPRRSRGRSTS